MAMIEARSPGEREKGELAQTKIKHKLAQVPRERALGKTFPPRPTPAEQLARVIIPAPPPVAVVPPVAPPAVADIISPASLIANAPLSVGSAIIGAGFAVASASLSAAAVVLGYLVVTLTAAMRGEEAHLTEKFGAAYPEYREGRAPAAPRRFSLARAVANREHRAVAGLAVVLALLWWKAL